MRYQTVGHGVDITPALKDYSLKKLSKMEKYFSSNESVKCTITFSLIKIYQVVEISINAADMYLRAKVSDQKDAYAAIDLAVDKLEGQMRKMKTQLLKSQKKNSIAKDIILDKIEEEEEQIDKIVKRKSLSLVPMDVEEALARMDALGHDFFIYLDSKTNKRSILYRRDDNTLGVIEIE
jgi:putative sigma-54 modulation protein